MDYRKSYEKANSILGRMIVEWDMRRFVAPRYEVEKMQKDMKMIREIISAAENDTSPDRMEEIAKHIEQIEKGKMLSVRTGEIAIFSRDYLENRQKEFMDNLPKMKSLLNSFRNEALEYRKGNLVPIDLLNRELVDELCCGELTEDEVRKFRHAICVSKGWDDSELEVDE